MTKESGISHRGSERGDMTASDDDALLFEGNAALMKLLAQLYPIPAKGEPNRPLICLIRDDHEPELLPSIRARIASGLEVNKVLSLDLRNPPSQERPMEVTVDDVTQVRKVLTALAKQLGGTNDRRQRVHRFRRFALLSWLMDQQITPAHVDQSARERALRSSLRTRDRYRLPEIPNDLAIPAWLRAATIPLMALLYRARVGGRIPLLSGYYRWVMRPQAIAPRRAGNALGVMLELTRDDWPHKPETTLLFLVNSFMEDLRAAYRSPVKRFLGVRRTTCCLLAISNITRRNGGYQLLRAINEVRNRTQLADPLLVITESLRVPPFATMPATVDSVAAADVAYQAWTNTLDQALREQGQAAWFLPLKVPPPPQTPEQRHPLRQRLAATPAIVAPHEPHLRKTARLGTAGLLVAAGAFSYLWWSQTHCGNGLSWPGLSPTVAWANDECVGVSDDLTVLFSPLDDSARSLNQLVHALNDEVDDRHDQQPARPIVTLVYLGALSVTGPNTGALAAESEGLKGMAVAQRRQLDATASTEPLVKVIFANAGQRMANGVQVAAWIGSVASADPTLVGVVGLNQSYQATSDTVDALANHGVPTIAVTISTDSFADEMLMYYQIAPQNRREAAVAAAYADAHTPPGDVPARSVRIYFSDNSADLYSRNLAADASEAFSGHGFSVERVSFTPDGSDSPGSLTDADRHVANANQAGTDSCGHPGLVFYAGRPAPDFGQFLASARNCLTTPRILADDDTTRHAANPVARRQYPSVPFDYVAFAVTTPSQASASPELDFYNSYGRMFPTDNPADRSLDGYAALAFDAAETFITSVQHLRSGRQSIPISPTAVWRQISSITAPRGIRGASGYIDFGGENERRVPRDKQILVLQVRGGEVQSTTKSYCGPAHDPRTQPWCPFDPPR
ncbi:hypothetical protein [Pseudonocardia spinosispora]|uniref:hypothetical protein n=1 Tax=Pseudonocardia spinosispora TaxID=103441 RepID=UPI00040FFF8D|nr:hypothetical protein [Pseudonocardia spinosispora]